MNTDGYRGPSGYAVGSSDWSILTDHQDNQQSLGTHVSVEFQQMANVDSDSSMGTPKEYVM